MNLADLDLNDYEIGFILKKENSNNYLLLLYNDNEEGSSFIIETDGINYTMNEIQVWDFNLDDYLFEYLENGYDILYN